MKVSRMDIPDVLLIEPRVFEDSRGYFFESFNEASWKEHCGFVPKFVQDNESMSHKGVLRGLHFQAPPHAQAKLVRVIRGAVYDVAVDLRIGSPTYGKWCAAELSAHNKRQLYIPEGFAHGFLVLEDSSIFSYKCSDLYHRESEGAIKWDDPELGIQWPEKSPLISDKDRLHASPFNSFESPFT